MTNETKSIDFRLKQLKKLKSAVEKYSDELYDALWKDLHKCKEEAFLTEITIVLNEINDHIKNIKKWARPEKVKTPVYLMPSKSYVTYEPFGVALIIALELSFQPDVHSFGQGNLFWLLRCLKAFALFSKHFGCDAENDRRDLR